MYISQDTVIKAIDNLSKVQEVKTKKKSSSALPFLLILNKLGISEYKFLQQEELKKEKTIIQKSFFELGGLFDKNRESPNTKCCLFFTSFSKNRKDFYNQKEPFDKLYSRFGDTLDNSVADHILDVRNADDDKFYRLTSNYITNINKMYDRKFPLYSLLIWLFRLRKIENNITLDDLKNQFIDEYNLSDYELHNLFDFSNNIELDTSNNPIEGQKIREKLQVVNEVDVQINSGGQNTLQKIYPEPKTDTMIKHQQLNMKEEEILTLLEKHKQLILTGVPGTGKTYTANQILQNYSDYKKIQFHENYTYQDFILGQTIKNGSVNYEKGDLINFLDKIQKKQNKNNNFLLILDEINRGNISSIFGELIYALDRDDNNIVLKAEDNNIEINLPDNLHLLGTMNSADRSIAVVDFAIRRRFLFVELEPDYNKLDELAKVNGKEILGKFLSKVNQNIEDNFENKDYCLGHSLFLTSKEIDNDYIYDILNYKIYPTIIEYGNGDRTILENIFSKDLLNAERSNIVEKIEEFIK